MSPGEAAARATITLAARLPLPQRDAFGLVEGELIPALAQRGIQVEPRQGGRISENDATFGSVAEWQPPERIVLEWNAAPWQDTERSRLELRFAPDDTGTRLELEHRHWGSALGASDDIGAWFARALLAPMLTAIAPAALGDWITDRMARAPSGPQARAVYRDPLYHYPNFRVILAELALQPADYFLEVGCGGGALLKDALRSGCRAAAIDHSTEMVALAREENAAAVAEGRLVVHHASADRLPFPDDSFTCAAMTGVLGFLPDPVAALGEIRRVLRSGGRLVVLGSDPELRGSPAAPEPFASRLRFYDDEQLRELGRAAGFTNARVERRDLEEHARASGVPEEHVPLFAGDGTRFLLARKE